MKTTANPHKKIPVGQSPAPHAAKKNPLSNSMANTPAYTAFQGNAPTPAAQLQNRITQSPRLALQKKHLNRLFGTGRPLQCLTDEDVESKEDKKRKKKLSEKYSDSLGFGKPLYIHAEETFDYYFTKASSLDNLELLIDTAIEKATKKKQAAESKKTKEEEAPVKPVSTTSPTVALPTPEKAPLKSKKEKPRDITSEVLTGGSSYKQETVYVTKDATNTLLQTWIGGKPGGATCAFDSLYVSEDTVYIYATVEMKDLTVTEYPQINQYLIETHYHPVPKTSNYLHVKARAGGLAGNVLLPTNWLIPGGNATLKQAVQAWDKANPTNKSSHKW